MKEFILALLCLCSTTLFAQDLTVEDCREDLIQLKTSIKEYNPALEVYNADFEEKANTLIESLPNEPLSYIDHFQLISQICALSNEGHFKLGNWEDTVHKGFVAERYRYIPLGVKVLNQSLYVWYDLSDEQVLERGDQISAINGRSTSEILDLFYKSYPSDGAITTFIDRKIERGFSWMYYLFIEQLEHFEIEIVMSDGSTKLVYINALPRQKHFINLEQHYPQTAEVEETTYRQSGKKGFYDLQLEEKTAIVKLPSFDYRRVNKFEVNAKKIYKALFAELEDKGIENLIIDLRNNTGGKNEFADEMVAYIHQSKDRFLFLKKSISWEGKEKIYKSPKASKLQFKGEIYVLINGLSFSAGSTLARYLKEYGNAIIIGEESGGRYEGYAAGSAEYITLNHSRLSVGIPRYHTFYPQSKKQNTENRGVLPDHKISYTIIDLMENRDLEMEKAKALIEQN